MTYKVFENTKSKRNSESTIPWVRICFINKHSQNFNDTKNHWLDKYDDNFKIIVYIYIIIYSFQNLSNVMIMQIVVWTSRWQ